MAPRWLDRGSEEAAQVLPSAERSAADDWIAVQLVGEDARPIPGERCRIQLPDGSARDEALDGEGFIAIRGIRPGPCAVTFPELDRDAWMSLGEADLPSRRTNGRSPAQRWTSQRRPIPDGGTTHRVRQGENIESLAFLYGHVSVTLRADARNAPLRAKRHNLNVLSPGDEFFIPALRRRSEAAHTGALHRFKRIGVPSLLRFRALVGGQPLAREPFRVAIDGQANPAIEGATDGNGFLECFVPPDAVSAEVRVGLPPQVFRYTITLRTLDPITQTTGIQGRLKNLGLYEGAVDGGEGPATHAAVSQFQMRCGLPVTGEADDATRRRLLELHQS
ncbi:peptidoglycan-binding domain-containing protein [Sorangium sp. So ce145]|uniref:peptidoglycan-binding domain-containing protein n=1 Tax=Sorangium sp. So ce145 TaxID=3133285 RepID=UPI003F604DF9